MGTINSQLVHGKLTVLAKWLRNSESNIEPFEGHLESLIKIAKQEVRQEIGELLLEVLELTFDDVREEVKDA
jgi:hypothetical protein